MKILEKLSEKVLSFDEYSYGANKVTLILKENRRIENVILAWGNEIVKIGNKLVDKNQELDFKAEDIIDVLSEK